MKRIFGVLVSACFVILSVNSALASTQCFIVFPYQEIIQVTVTPQDPSNPGNKIISGAFYAPGLYYLPLVGTIVIDADGIHKRFSAHATNKSTAFGGNLDCALDATLDPTARPVQGPLSFACGGFVHPPATLIKVDCSTSPGPLTDERSSPDAQGFDE